ncbi:MAG: class I SAM-dependent methyltransferase [Burkholderiales bacterium]
MAQRHVSDTWERGNPYERYVGRWSRKVAPPFLSWLGARPGLRWLDVGCGTGTLCAAIVDLCTPDRVSGIDPSEGFLATARDHLGDRAELRQAGATAIPLDDACVDVVVSGLVLNFIADPNAALREMKRVLAPGGTIAGYVWDYAGKMDLMRHFWNAAAALDSHAVALDEGVRFPLCHPDALRDLFARAGLNAIDVTAIDIATPFESFDDYWQPFLGGQGPAPAYAMSLDEAARARLRDRIQSRLPMSADGSIALMARAWCIRGRL